MRWLTLLILLFSSVAFAQMPFEDPVEIYIDGSGQAAGNVSLEGGFKLLLEGTDTYIYSDTANTMKFYTNDTYRLAIGAGSISIVNSSLLFSVAGKRFYSSADVLSLGSVCTTSHTLLTGDVCFGAGASVEFDDVAYFDAQVNFATHAIFGDNDRAYFGSNFEGGMEWFVGASGGDALYIFTATNSDENSGNIIVTEDSNISKLHDHANTVDPYFIIHSATNPDTANDQWIGFKHDQADARIETGKGDVKSLSIFDVAEVYTTRKQFEDNFFWSSSVLGSAWDITNVTGAGTNAIGCAGRGSCDLLTTGAAGAGDYESTWSNVAAVARSIQPDMEAHITLNTDLVGKEVRVGFCDTPGDGTGCTDYAFFLFDYSADNVNWWHSSGDAVDASLAVGPTAGTQQQLRIKMNTAGQSVFYIDDVIVATVAGTVGADTALYFFWAIETEAAQAEIMELDHIHVSHD